jgi:spermidine synthase
MSEIKEYEERDGEFIRILRYYPEGSLSFQTAKQKIDILNTVLFGRTLFVNGVLQSSVADEHLYHMSLVTGVHELLNTRKNICILGGGEGATARAVLARLGERSDAHVTMIDWDTELVTHFRKNEPRWTTQFLGGNVFDDSRLTVEHSDIFKILEEPRIYDCMAVVIRGICKVSMQLRFSTAILIFLITILVTQRPLFPLLVANGHLCELLFLLRALSLE